MQTVLRAATCFAVALVPMLASTVPASAKLDWRVHAVRRYFVANAEDFRELNRRTFDNYRTACERLEIKEYPDLERINYICEL